jgi:hypothetical protein
MLGGLHIALPDLSGQGGRGQQRHTGFASPSLRTHQQHEAVGRCMPRHGHGQNHQRQDSQLLRHGAWLLMACAER